MLKKDINPIIFIIGPTSIGKTKISIDLANELNAQIISCDSMLIYKEPSIISSKPTEQMLNEIKHHFINIRSVEQEYNVFQYYKSASKKIDDLQANGVSTIVCGGTGLYVKALCEGIFQGQGKDDMLRKQLVTRAEKEGVLSLYSELKVKDPAAAFKISANDLKRIIRALEVYEFLGVPISEKQKQSYGISNRHTVKMYGLTCKRDVLYERINKRVQLMFEQGAVEEVKKLLDYNLSLTAGKMIGINEISRYINGELNKCESMELMKKNTRNYAKRQLTWFKADRRVKWIPVDDMLPDEVVTVILRDMEADNRGSNL